DRFVYTNYDRVVATLQVFEDCNETKSNGLTDQMTNALVEAVYSNGYSTKEQDEFDFTRENFLGVWNAMQPFYPGSPDEFYQLFDSVEVIPKKFYDEVMAILEEGRKWQLSQYSINIRYSMFKRLYSAGLIDQIDDIYLIDIEYNPEYGLSNPDYKRNGGSFVW
ncbi:MAG: hypothetical protein P1Q69_21510, partial [Candidatus Thorarchaeota archaeon]|nr:hypothetical protein [Candidatus Thorarchaeota archaeon]